MPREHEDYRAYLELIREKIGKDILNIGEVMIVTGKSRFFVNNHIMNGVKFIGSCTLARMMCRGFK